jgi:hypothetical protein
MRMLSRKWPARMTFCAIIAAILDPGNTAQLIGVSTWAILAWLIYGIACLLAYPQPGTLSETPWPKSGDSIPNSSEE